jgi:hypothetical protein
LCEALGSVSSTRGERRRKGEEGGLEKRRSGEGRREEGRGGKKREEKNSRPILKLQKVM